MTTSARRAASRAAYVLAAHHADRELRAKHPREYRELREENTAASWVLYPEWDSRLRARRVTVATHVELRQAHHAEWTEHRLAFPGRDEAAA